MVEYESITMELKALNEPIFSSDQLDYSELLKQRNQIRELALKSLNTIEALAADLQMESAKAEKLEADNNKLSVEVDSVSKKLSDLQSDYDKVSNDFAIADGKLSREKDLVDSTYKTLSAQLARWQSQLYAVGGPRFFKEEVATRENIADFVIDFANLESYHTAYAFYSKLGKDEKAKFEAFVACKLSSLTKERVDEFYASEKDLILEILQTIAGEVSEIKDQTIIRAEAIGGALKVADEKSNATKDLIIQNSDKITETISGVKNNVSSFSAFSSKTLEDIRKDALHLQNLVEELSSSMDSTSSSFGDTTSTMGSLIGKFDKQTSGFTSSLTRLNELLSKLSEQLSSMVINNQKFDNSNDRYSQLIDKNDERTIQTHATIIEKVNLFQKKCDEFIDKMPGFFKALSDSIVDVKVYITSSLKSWISQAEASADSQITLGTDVDALWENFKEASGTVEQFNAALKTISEFSNTLGDIYALYDNISTKIPSMEKLSELLDVVVKDQHNLLNNDRVKVALQAVDTGIKLKQEFIKEGAF